MTIALPYGGLKIQRGLLHAGSIPAPGTNRAEKGGRPKDNFGMPFLIDQKQRLLRQTAQHASRHTA